MFQNNPQNRILATGLKEYDEKKVQRSVKEEKFYCSVCGREISEEDFQDYDGMCWECWDDQLTEESDDMFGDFI